MSTFKKKYFIKRIISTLFLFLSIYCLIFAEPADPTPRKVIQSNGDTILISLHGDEYGSWYEDYNGNVIVATEQMIIK